MRKCGARLTFGLPPNPSAARQMRALSWRCTRHGHTQVDVRAAVWVGAEREVKKKWQRTRSQGCRNWPENAAVRHFSAEFQTERETGSGIHREN
jgi:hypothetical protein